MSKTVKNHTVLEHKCKLIKHSVIHMINVTCIRVFMENKFTSMCYVMFDYQNLISASAINIGRPTDFRDDLSAEV